MEEINKTHPDLDSKKIKDFKLTINSIEHDRGTNLGIMIVDKNGLLDGMKLLSL
jgi:hypothetical protein